MLAKDVISSRWTLQTLHCYWAKTNCEICPENEICTKYGSNNVYGIKAVKYAMLKTLEKLGKPTKKDITGRIFRKEQ